MSEDELKPLFIGPRTVVFNDREELVCGHEVLHAIETVGRDDPSFEGVPVEVIRDVAKGTRIFVSADAELGGEQRMFIA